MTLVEHGHDLSGATAARPTNAEIGQQFYDTTTGRNYVWNGTAWQESGGSKLTVSFVYGEAVQIDMPFFVATRAYTITKITVRPLVVGSDGGGVTAEFRKAGAGVAMASGTILHTGTANLKGTINTNQVLTLEAAANIAIANGDAIGIDVTGTMTAARGVVTVELEPAAGEIVASHVYGDVIAIDNAFFVAPAACVVRSIILRPLVAGTDAGAVTAVVKKAASGTAMASGTALHTSTIDLKATVNTNLTPTLEAAANITLAAGDAVGLDVTGTMTAARGVVSVAFTLL